jgi:hypothetical protein
VENKEMKPEDQCALTRAELLTIDGFTVVSHCPDPICGHKFSAHHAGTNAISSDHSSVGQKRKKTLSETEGQVLCKKTKTNDGTTLFVKKFIPRKVEALLEWTDGKEDGLHAHLHERNATREISQFLTDAKNEGWEAEPVIIGPPGSGKSTAVWQWVQKTRLDGEICIYWRMVGTKQDFYAVSDDSVKRLIVKSLEDCGGFGDFIVLDGVRGNNLVDAVDAIRIWCGLRDFYHCPAIICMSQGAPRGKPSDIEESGQVVLFVEPWTWQEMLATAESDAFVKEHYQCCSRE